MKNKTLPPIRVAPDIRRKVLSALEEGETLSAFILESVSFNLERRKSHAEFIARGLLGEMRAKATGRYFSSEQVFKNLEKQSARAKKRPPRS